MSFFERLKTGASAEWRAYTEHPFTNGLADGSLAEAAFRHYLVQDYLFLTEFARAYALSVYKSPKLADMREAAAGLSAILDIEMNLHVMPEDQDLGCQRSSRPEHPDQRCPDKAESFPHRTEGLRDSASVVSPIGFAIGIAE